jgi:hypothetical protein
MNTKASLNFRTLKERPLYKSKLLNKSRSFQVRIITEDCSSLHQTECFKFAANSFNIATRPEEPRQVKTAQK